MVPSLETLLPKGDWRPVVEVLVGGLNRCRHCWRDGRCRGRRRSHGVVMQALRLTTPASEPRLHMSRAISSMFQIEGGYRVDEARLR